MSPDDGRTHLVIYLVGGYTERYERLLGCAGVPEVTLKRQDRRMEITHLFAGLVVSNFTEACGWYERLFDSPPHVLPREGEALWHAGGSASVYITADEAQSGRGRLTLAVKNLDRHAADLGRRGLIGGASAEPNGMRTLLLADPDGNTIKLFEDPATQ